MLVVVSDELDQIATLYCLVHLIIYVYLEIEAIILIFGLPCHSKVIHVEAAKIYYDSIVMMIKATADEVKV
jgi:hypothetical protein